MRTASARFASSASLAALVAFVAACSIAPAARAADASDGATTVTAPPGSPGLTVVSPYPGGGQVVASGCSQVTVNGAPTWVTSGGAPCPPQYAPYQPYVAAPPVYERPRRAPDGERSGALIASSIVFGLGSAAAGLAYVIQYENDDSACGNTFVSTANGTYTVVGAKCAHASARTSLVTYGAIVGLAPSVPRWMVGDLKGGLVFAGLRVASVAAAALVPWGDGDGKWTGAFLFGFAAPIALGIVDLAMTPHREELEGDAAAAAAAKGPRITGVAPVALTDRGGTHGAMLALGGRF